MAINPLTGKEEELTVLPSQEGSTNSPVNPQGFGTNQGPTTTVEVKPTVATESSPIVNRGTTDTTTGFQDFVAESSPTIGGTSDTGDTDLRVTNIDSVLSDQDKRSLVDKERDRIRNLEGVSFEDRNKQFRKLTEDIQSGAFFGGETQLESERQRAADAQRRLQEQTGEAITSAEDIFRQDLERETTRIQEQGQKVMDTTQRLNSLRGGGRSSANEAAINRQQEQISGLITAAQKNSDLKLQQRKMQIEGASADAQASISEALAANEKILNERIGEAMSKQAELDAQIGADFAQSAENIVGVAATAGLEVGDFDDKASKALGYISDEKGRPLIRDANGDPVAPKNQFGMDAKISNFKDANDNTYVYTNGKLTSIIDNQGNILQGDKLNTVKVPAQVTEDKTIAQRRSTETSLRNEFIKRPEVKRFQEINSQFARVNEGASADSAAGDIALVFSFMKMLDPGSVVRESEFATAENAQGAPEQVRNLWNKLLTGKRFGDNDEDLAIGIRDDFLQRSKNLMEVEKGNFNKVKEGFSTIIQDAGARPEFVILDDFAEEQEGFKLEEDEQLELNELFPTNDAGESQFETTSGNQFNIKLGGNSGEPTSATNTIQSDGFTEGLEINRTGTNVAKDTNNPGNITADSIPAGQSKEEYGKTIGAIGTYLSPNGREYFVFPDTDSGTAALQRDITAKISGGSRNIKPTDTLARFQRVYVGATEPNYLAVLKRITGASDNTPIKDINPELLTQAVMKAEGFNS